MHDVVTGRKHRPGRAASGCERRPAVGANRQGPEPRLPARAVEVGHADVEIPDRM